MRLLMEDETKKRKLTNIELYEEEEEEEEEVKIEKFFALIRSAKDIRDQLIDSEGTTRPPPLATTNKAVGKTVAKNEKRTEVIAKAQRMEKSTSLKDSQNVVAKKPHAGTGIATKSLPPAFAYAPASVSERCVSKSGGGGGGDKIINLSPPSEEEKRGKKSTEGKKNYQEGRIMLDLNLSL